MEDVHSGVAMGWAGWSKSRGPRVQGPQVPDQKFKRNNLRDLQILGCELHKNAFGGWAPPGFAGGAIALPQAP